MPNLKSNFRVAFLFRHTDESRYPVSLNAAGFRVVARNDKMKVVKPPSLQANIHAPLRASIFSHSDLSKKSPKIRGFFNATYLAFLGLSGV